MATKSYTIITLERLQKYDSLIKPFIAGKVSDAVAKTFKAVSIDGFTLKFYTVEHQHLQSIFQRQTLVVLSLKSRMLLLVM